MSFEATALVLAWGAITLLAFAMAGLLRQVKALTLLISGDSVTPAGPARGQQLPTELLVNGSTTGAANGPILVFMDHNCPGCAALAPELTRLGAENRLDIRLVFREAANGAMGGELNVLEGMSAAFERLQIPATPFAVSVGEPGVIADAAPIGSPQALRAFVESCAEEVTHGRK